MTIGTTCLAADDADDWDSMLIELARGRARQLLEEAVSTLEAVETPADATLTVVVDQLRGSVARLSLRS